MARLKLRYKTSFKSTPLAYQPAEVEYVGRVVQPKPRWLSENEFMLTTGDIDAPVRILDKRDIIEAWVGNENFNDGVTLVPGDKRTYVVTRGPFGRYSCDCTAFNFRRKCSHIDGVRK